MEVIKLTCNYANNPLGVDTPKPRFGWLLRDDKEHNRRQIAYQIRVARQPSAESLSEAALWDSGRVLSEQSTQILYAGEPLKSRQHAYWQVRVWDQDNRPSAWSEVAEFEMGLLLEDDWHGHWIGHPDGGTTADKVVSAPLLRRAIHLKQNVQMARAYISGLGYYEFTVNGQKVGDQVLAPAFTRYDHTVLYQTFDITEFLSTGDNVLGVMLGNGFYNVHTVDVWGFHSAEWRDQPKCLVQVEVTLEDGHVREFVSGPDWQASFGPIVFDGVRNGESYDARRERPGWDCPGFDAYDWKSVKIVRSPGGVMRSEQMPPIRVIDTLKPVSRQEVQHGTFVFDFGQNLSGWARIRVAGPAGSTVTLKYGEILTPEGAVDNEGLSAHVKSGDFQTDRYTLKGSGVETWEPRFVYHGFQYVEVSGWPGVPEVDDIEARVVHTDLSSRGDFACSNDLLNQIQRAARWSTLTNYHGFPTDCPHREKNGWTGDAALSAEQVLFNLDPAAAYTKWMQDFRDAQRPSGQLPGIIPSSGWGYNWGSGPSWDSATILIPWFMYVYLGDRAILREMYHTMAQYVSYAMSMAVDGIADFGLGDWCPPYGRGDDQPCPTAVTDTASLYGMVAIMSRVAEILNRYDDRNCYRHKAQEIRAAFRKAFWDSDKATIAGDCQTSLACALYYGLLNQEESARAMQRLMGHVESRDFHLDTGILGAKYIMHSLSHYGHSDAAYAIANQTTFPSWGYEICQGATTLWERWDGTASRNHHMYSDVSAWFYKWLVGIQPDELDPGFHHIYFRPNPVPGLRWAYADHMSPYGPIKCRWELDESVLKIDVTVPVNTYATMELPSGYSQVLSDGGVAMEPLSVAGEAQDRLEVTFGSGTYQFSITKE